MTRSSSGSSGDANRNPDRRRGHLVLHNTPQDARAELCRNDLPAHQMRLEHRRLTQDARAGDVDVERDDGETRGW
jgi:hypothetical protein